MAKVAPSTSPRLKGKPDLPEYEERRCLNLYSESELMRNVADYITECMSFMGYQEEHLYTNMRIGISGVACIVALYATVGIRFPEQSQFLRVCVITFFSLLFILFVLEALYVKSAFLAVYDKFGNRLLIDGYMIRPTAQVAIGLRQPGKELTHTSSVERYFDVNGYMVTDNVFKDLQKLLSDFDHGFTKATKPKSSKKKTF